MESVDCFARVVRVFPAKNFSRSDGRKGAVANIMISDGTETRLALWDEQSDWAAKLEPGDTVKIEGAYVRDNKGRLELNLGRRGRLVRNPEEAPEIAGVDAVPSERKKISELREGDTYKEVRAVVVMAYPPTLFSFCPKCGKKADGRCGECGVDAKQAVMVNSELDDGTGIIRGVFFRNLAEQLLGVTASEFQESGYDTNKILGIEKIFQGQVKKNQRFERDEFIVRRVKDVDLEAEMRALEVI
jgi:replication factor A1